MRKRLIIAVPTSRNGSTFLMRVLNAHPEVCITNEARLYRLRFWPCHFLQAIEVLDRYPIGKKAGVPALRREFGHVSKDYPDIPLRYRDWGISAHCIKAVENALFGKDRKGYVGDKGYLPLPPPSHDRAVTIEEAIKLFSDMRVIFLHRDPRDVLTSMYRTHKRYVERGIKLPLEHPSRWDKNPAWHPTRTFDVWRQSREWAWVMKRWREEIAPRCSSLKIRYEGLMDDPESALREVGRFLGLDPSSMVKEFHKRVAHRDHVGYWRRLLPDLEKKAHPSMLGEMKRWGYK